MGAIRFSLAASLSLFACQNAIASLNSFYCPERAGFIQPGMNMQSVMNACGNPLSRQESNQPVMQRIPVQQLIYNNVGAPTAFYGVWQITGGSSNYGIFQPFGNNQGGVSLEVNLVDNKVRSIKMNGSETNSASICQELSFSVGDPASSVYNACGTPSLVNESFLEQPVPGGDKPEVWIYQPNQFQAPLRLTFVNGKLQSIDQ